MLLPILTSPGTAAPLAPPPPSPVHGALPNRLIDSHGRTIHDLRLSITDRCNFRCLYCMDPDVRFLPTSALLTTDQLGRIARICTGLGIRTIRLTGGEPTVHPDLIRIITQVAASGVANVAMTTNGSLLTPDIARQWKNAGLDRITFSIDSAEESTFSQMTRSATSAASVINAIRIARDEGLGPVKANAVILRGRNEHQILPLAQLARDLDIDMRFIEYMPLDSGRHWDRTKLVPADEIAATIQQRFPLTPVGKDHDHSTSLSFTFADGAPGRIGLIAPVSRPFCGACSRLRITADGKVRPCLFSLTEFDLAAPMRDGASDAQLSQFLIDSVWTKQKGHGIQAPDFVQPDRPMSAIGG
ncbi:MAG: GTP 3',8-cyclase MoaA [Planctomycetota bacterium]|nr:GTP 3',8-cyclase MoaA [Planctomycetota bacterium]